MQHTWNENDICERCGIKRVQETIKQPLPYAMGYKIVHRITYYKNGLKLPTRPDCYFPGQYLLAL